MNEHEEDIDALLSQASRYDRGFLLYVLGGAVLGPSYQPQSAGTLREAGATFFERFKAELHSVICGKNGPYQNFIKGVATHKDLPKLLVVAILSGRATIDGVTITHTIAIYSALLLLQSGLAAYCEKPE